MLRLANPWRSRPDGRGARRRKSLGGSAASTSRRARWLVVFGALVGAAIFNIGNAQPAISALHNPIPFNELGDPTDEFTDDEAVFAYVTSDIKGGEVCIVSGSFTSANGLSCGGAAWGGKNTVVGIGSQIVPIAAPPLKPGTWRLLATDSEGNNGELSVPFTIVSCTDNCDISIAADILAGYKAAAQQNLVGAAATCLTFAAKSLKGTLIKARGRVKTLDATAKDYETGGGFAALIVGGAAFGLSFASIPDLSNPGEEEALGILKDLTCTLTSMYSDIVADPADPNYDSVTPPSYSTIPSLPDAARDTLADAVDHVRGLGVAARHALERYQGALAAGATPFIHAQATAVDEFTTEQIAQTQRTSAALRALAGELDTDPNYADVAATSAERDALISIYHRVAADGFTTDELGQLHSLGYSDADIAIIRSHFAVDPTRLPADTTVQAQLRDLADTLDSNLDAFDLMAREAATIAGRTNQSSGGNNPPAAADDTFVTPQNTPKTGDVLANDSDPDGDTLAVTGSTDGAHGSVSCSSAGNCTYTPATDYTGSDSFTYTVSDGRGGSATATVFMTITAAGGPNHPPVASDDTFSTKRNTAKVVFVLGNDSDPDLDALTLVGNTNPLHGAVSCIDTGVCTYTPATDYLGPDGFEYTVSDGIATDTAQVHFTVVVNTPPVAVDDELSTVSGVAGTAFVLFNDSDPDGDGLSLTDNTDGAHGSVSCDSGGVCTYTSTGGFSGDDSFVYTISDGNATDTGTVHVTVTAPCAPAVCIDNGTVLMAVRPEGNLNSPDGTGSAAGSGDVGLEFLPTGNDSTSPGCLCEGWGVADAESRVSGYADVSSGGVVNLDVVSFTHTKSTAVSVVDIGDTLRVTQDYHPSPDTPDLYEDMVTIENISGHALGDIRYRRVMDWDIEPTPFSEFVTINPGNASELLFDSDNGFEVPDPLGARSSFGNTGSFVDAGPSDHGALFDFGFGALGAGENKTFSVFYGAAANEAEAVSAVTAAGAEVFSFGQPSTADGPTLGTPNTFIFAFGNVGGTPIFSPDAVDDDLTTPSGTPGSLNVLANDTDPNGDQLTVTTSTPSAAHGSVTCAATGTCTYTPAATYAGPDSFDYAISDGHGGSDTATVHVTVTSANHKPDAVDDILTTDAGTAASTNVLANDTDADGDTLSVTANTQGAHGSVSCTAAGSCTYTPAAGFSGSDSFDYSVSDGHGGTDSATVHVTVNAKKATSTTYTGASTVQYSDAATLSGTLRDTSVSPPVGIAGKQLDFTLGSQTAHANPTNGSGSASTSLVVTQKPGSATSVATAFAGDGSYQASSDADAFSITKEDCTLAYSGNTLVAPTTYTTLAADLGEPDSSLGDRSSKTIVFTLVDASLATQTFTATTNASGHASTSVPLADGVYGVSLSFAGDDYYQPCATSEDVLVTVEAATAKVTGGGWTSVGTGRTSFGFNAIPQAGGLWKGQFQLRSNSGKSKFHGNTVSALAVSGNTAKWSGTGRWNGQAGFTYSIAVVDNGPSGGKKGDTISITIKSSTGAVVFSTNGPQALKGGNITIHRN